MPDTPLNPDALEAAYAAYAELTVEEWRTRPHSAWRKRLIEDVNIAVSAYLAVTQPELQANSKPNQNFEVVNILEILEAHTLEWVADDVGNYECACGFYPDPFNGTDVSIDDQHRAHVAEVLDKHMQEREAAVIAGLAELLDEYRNSHEVAECAAPVEGETGRQAVIERWESITEEPAEWLREQSKLHHERGFEHLRYVAYEAWQAGEDAGWENGRNSYMKEQGFIEDIDPIENPYTDEEAMA